MNSPNDRYRIILLQRLQHRTPKERRELRNLSERYPDNERFTATLIDNLSRQGLLESVGAEAEQNEFGDFVRIQNDFEPYYITTELGRAALLGSFESETAKERPNKRFRTIEIVGLVVAAVGGLTGLFAFVKELIQRFLK